MHTFEITIQRATDDGWPVVVEHTQSGHLPIRTEGSLALDDRAQADLLGQEQSPQAYGTLLGQALFRDGVRDAFMQARIASEADTLRVLLVVEAPDLKSIRWERLCTPGGRAAVGVCWPWISRCSTPSICPV